MLCRSVPEPKRARAEVLGNTQVHFAHITAALVPHMAL
jgi:hypothetical protein